MRLREQANTGIGLPEIGFGTWNWRGGVGPLRTAIEYGACLIDTAEAYGPLSVTVPVEERPSRSSGSGLARREGWSG